MLEVQDNKNLETHVPSNIKGEEIANILNQIKKEAEDKLLSNILLFKPPGGKKEFKVDKIPLDVSNTTKC